MWSVAVKAHAPQISTVCAFREVSFCLLLLVRISYLNDPISTSLINKVA